jgi:hypothetical protein
MRKLDFLDLPLHVVVALWILRQFAYQGQLEKASFIYTDPEQELKALRDIARYEKHNSMSVAADGLHRLGHLEKLALRVYGRYMKGLDADIMVAKAHNVVSTGMFRRG